MKTDETERLEIRRANLRNAMASQGNEYLKQVLRLEINRISEQLQKAAVDH